MDDLGGLSDRDADRLLAGVSLSDGDAADGMPAVAELLEELREEYLKAPPEAVEQAHLAAIVAESRRVITAPADDPVTPAPASPAPSPRRRLGLVFGVLLLTLPLPVSGLAVAGVNLPDPLVAPFEAVGIDLPNQEDSDDAETPGIDPASGRRDLGQADQRRRSGSSGRTRKGGGATAAPARRNPKVSAPTSPRSGSGAGSTDTGAVDSPPGSKAPRVAPRPESPAQTSPPSIAPDSKNGNGPPTAPPGNSGNNPFGGPPGLTGEGPPGQTGAAPPDRGGSNGAG